MTIDYLTSFISKKYDKFILLVNMQILWCVIMEQHFNLFKITSIWTLKSLLQPISKVIEPKKLNAISRLKNTTSCLENFLIFNLKL